MYNPKSRKAEEFIDHQEVLDSLAYAQAHKSDAALIDQLLDKARLGKGLTHREAAVLLDCDLPEKNREIFALAKEIKQRFYGNRIVMFLLSLSWHQPAYSPEKIDPGGDPPGGHRPSGHGTQAAGH